MPIVKVTCGWCREDFDTDNGRRDNTKDTSSYSPTVCQNCGRVVKSSKKEVGDKKNIKRALKAGDVV